MGCKASRGTQARAPPVPGIPSTVHELSCLPGVHSTYLAHVPEPGASVVRVALVSSWHQLRNTFGACTRSVEGDDGPEPVVFIGMEDMDLKEQQRCCNQRWALQSLQPGSSEDVRRFLEPGHLETMCDQASQDLLKDHTNCLCAVPAYCPSRTRVVLLVGVTAKGFIPVGEKAFPTQFEYFFGGEQQAILIDVCSVAYARQWSYLGAAWCRVFASRYGSSH